MKHTKDKEIADGFTQPRFGGRIAMSKVRTKLSEQLWAEAIRLGKDRFQARACIPCQDTDTDRLLTRAADTIDNLTAEVARLRDACNQAYLELVQEVGPFPDLDDDWDILHGIAEHLRLAVDKENTDEK